MKIFEFDFYDNYELEHKYVEVLAHSEEEALELVRQGSEMWKDPHMEFRGCIDIYELDKPMIL